MTICAVTNSRSGTTNSRMECPHSVEGGGFGETGVLGTVRSGAVALGFDATFEGPPGVGPYHVKKRSAAKARTATTLTPRLEPTFE